MNLITFGAALEAAKQNKRIARQSKPMQYHFLRLATNVPASVVPKMNSLPDAVLRHAEQTGQGMAFDRDFGVARWDTDGKLQLTSWLPTFEDLVAEDWRVLD
jgi:predicted nucleic acid-binding Zn ribbon protein